MPNRRQAMLACLAMALGASVAFAFQRAFRELPGQEYNDFPLPPDYRQPSEFVFARLMYPQGSWGIWGRLFRFDWREGRSAWTNDYPRSDRHFALALRRLTRVETRSVEQPVNLDDGDDVFNWPWLYSVAPNHWRLSEEQIARLRDYLDRGGFLLADDFWGEEDWAYFAHSVARLYPSRPIVELDNADPIFHSVFDLSDRYQVPGEWSLHGLPYLNGGRDPHWRAVFDARGRIVIAILFNHDTGDSWEWADDPNYPERYSALGIRTGVNYVVYALTH